MGRSGGGSHKSSRSHSHSSSKSHKSSSSSKSSYYKNKETNTYSYGGGYSGSSYSRSRSNFLLTYKPSCLTECNWPSCKVMAVIIFIAFIILTWAIAIYSIIIATNRPGTPIISPGEQYLLCRGKKIQLKYKSTDIKVYQSLYGTPDMSEDTRNISVLMSGQLNDSYRYYSFFLPPESYLSGQKSTTAATFIVIKGEKQMKKFIGEDYYKYIYKSSDNTFELNSTVFDEYFVVVDSTLSTSFTAEINATIRLYDISNLTEQCTSNSTKCDLNEGNDPNFCIVIDYYADKPSRSVEVTISGDGVMFNKYVLIIMVCVAFGPFVIYFAIRGIAELVDRLSYISLKDKLCCCPLFKPRKEKVRMKIIQPEKEEEKEGETHNNTSSYLAPSPSDIPTAIITDSTETNNSDLLTYNPNDANKYPTEPPPPYTTQ